MLAVIGTSSRLCGLLTPQYRIVKTAYLVHVSLNDFKSRRSCWSWSRKRAPPGLRVMRSPPRTMFPRLGRICATRLSARR